MQTANVNMEDRLASINRKLADLLGVAELPLATGGGRSLDDSLWIWGVVGGKNVGKSTLINALAGGKVVDGGDGTLEGTLEPAAYCCDGDLERLQARLGSVGGVPVSYYPDAPESMRGLVLVDLPDFDSLFTDHVERVRRLAEVLDGIIWLTTPKKVGDLRAIREIRRVLKDRANFVYVVNKMDWLLSQNDGSPEDAMERMWAALHAQMSDSDANANGHRAFMVSAKHRDTSTILNAIARSRSRDITSGSDETLTAAAERISGDLVSLRNDLTTAPTVESASANKLANLSYQSRIQAGALSEHYAPRDLLKRLDSDLSPDVIEELVAESLTPSYCARLVRRLSCDRSLCAQWCSTLFSRRIGYWPLLGLIAWPLVLLGTVIGGLRSFLPGSGSDGDTDPFRLDGLSLEDRIEGLLAGVGARTAFVSGQVDFGLLSVETATTRFRGDVRATVEVQRAAVIEPYLRSRPSFVGRGLRWLLPLAVLIWFPLAQPILATILEGARVGIGLNLETAAVLVQGLSGVNVLIGLGVSVLILGALVAAVYSGAVRDSWRAMDLLGEYSADMTVEPLVSALADSIGRPIRDFRAELIAVTESLETLENWE